MKIIFSTLFILLSMTVFAKDFSDDSSWSHYRPLVYDNAYVVDTIEIQNPLVISFGFPGSYSDFSFVTDSSTAMKIVCEVKNIKKWSDCEKYFNNKNSIVNSCYVYMINTDYMEEEFLVNISKRRRNGKNLVNFQNCAPINDGIKVGAFDGHPILLSKFIPQKTEKFVLLLVNSGYLRFRCIDCSEERYYVPSILPWNKFVKVVFPLPN